MSAKALRKPVLIVGVAIVVATLLIMLKPQPVEVVPEQRPILVDVLEVQRQDLAIRVKAQGVVQPSAKSSLVSEVTGRIVEISDSFNAGGFFRAGDVLLRIDGRDYEARLRQAEAQVAQGKSLLAQERGRAEVAKREWLQRRGRNKVSAEASSLAQREPQMLEAEAQLESALAALQQAEVDLERTVIVAPYDGLVSAKSADIGQFVSAGSPIGEIMAVDEAEVRLAIPENKLSYLNLPGAFQSGDTEQASVALSYTLDGEQFEWDAQLVRTEGVLDQRSRSLFVVAQLHDPYGLYRTRRAAFTPLRFGMFVDAIVEGRNVADVISVPRSVIRPGNMVWIVDDSNRLQERKVSLLRTDGAEIFVTDGLHEGDRVSLTSVGPVLPGTRVDISSVTRQSEPDGKASELPADEIATKPVQEPAGAALLESASKPSA